MEHQKRDQLFGLLDAVRAEQDELFNGLPDFELTAEGAWEKWSAKDLLAHFNFWGNRLLDDLAHLEQTPPDDNADFDRLNRANYDRNRTRSYQDILQDNRDIYAEIKRRLEALDDEALMTAGRFPRLKEGTLASRVVGSIYTHNLGHLATLCIEHDEAARGEQLQENGIQKLFVFDSSPRLKGVTLYNLACFYALYGNAPLAIELLRESFPLREDLRELSKQDSDLVSLRALPEYQALYNAFQKAS